MTKRTRIVAIVACVLAAGLILAPAVLASTIVGDETYVVPAGETVEGNLYAFGQTVRVEGTVTGDLISAGTKVEIAPGGSVQGDVMAAGQSVIVGGDVDGDLRAAGFQVLVESGATIGGELMGAGFTVSLADGATVGDDFTAAARQALIDGTVEGDVRFGGDALDIQGTVGGDVDAEVSAPSAEIPDMTFMQFIPGMQEMPKPPRTAPPGLTIGPDAEIAGSVSYTSPAASEVAESAAGGGVTFTQQAAPEGESEAASAAAPATATSQAAGWLINCLKWYLSLAIVGLLLAWLAPRLLGSTGQVLSDKTLPSAGVGCGTILIALAGLVALGIATIFGLLFVGAIHLGPLVKPLLSASFLTFALLTAGLLLLAWIGRIAVSYWIGRLILGKLVPARAGNRYLCLLVGLLVYVPLVNLPWIGGLLDFVGILLGLGAVMMVLAGLLQSSYRGQDRETAPA